MSSLTDHYCTIRSRLFNPPNAVADKPVNLRSNKGSAMTGYQAERLRREAANAAKKEWEMQESNPTKKEWLYTDLSYPMTNVFTIILRCVCLYFDVTRIDLLSQRRHKDIVVPRQIACALAVKYTEFSLPKIGIVMGGRDHTTILHAVRKIKRVEKENPDIHRNMTELGGFIETKLAALRSSRIAISASP